MDSPTHFTRNPDRTYTSPFSRDNTLIHGHDIELAATKAPFEEQVTNPAPEVFQHSTLEAGKPPQSHPYLLPAFPSPYAKSWESHSRPTSPYSHTAVAATAAAPPASSGGPGERYSYTDFESPFDRRPLVSPPRNGGKRETICGVRRRLFWVVLAVGVFFVVVAVAVGVGLGVGLERGAESDSTTSSPPSTRTLPIPVATSTTSVGMSCPNDNLTLFPAQQNPSKKYLLLCGRDYNSNLGTTEDMFNTPTDTLAECLDICAGQMGCVGAGWGQGASSSSGRPTCWLKSRLGEPNEAAEWSFLVEDEGT